MLGLHQLAYIDTRAVVVHFSAVATLFCAASFFLFERDPSRHNTLDATTALMLLGLGITATIGQLCLTLLPMYIVLGLHMPLLLNTILLLGIILILKKTWWNRLKEY